MKQDETMINEKKKYSLFQQSHYLAHVPSIGVPTLRLTSQQRRFLL